jgi:uncharacterized protein YegL
MSTHPFLGKCYFTSSHKPFFQSPRSAQMRAHCALCAFLPRPLGIFPNHLKDHQFMKRRNIYLLAFLFSASLTSLAIAERDDDDHPNPSPEPAMHMPMKMEMQYNFDAGAIDGNLGATPGGAQDIAFARSQILDDQIPHPNVFTPEGLLSEHDLPLSPSATPCKSLFCAEGEAIEARLIAQPEVRYLAQLGFSSGLSAETFKRAPLNLIAVIDKSGSMSGQPLELVKKSLIEAVDKLNPDDQLTIILYGDQVHAHLPTSPIKDKKDIIRQIEAIESSGSTNMEAGLAMGFEVAKNTQKAFKGTSRVMLFTDERPNVGRTDAESFMGMAEAASLSGVGMTTIGVGVQFGAELATKISSVRGGNLFFFPDMDRMEKVFNEDFDFMVTELAHNMKLTLKAPPGFSPRPPHPPGVARRPLPLGALDLAPSAQIPTAPGRGGRRAVSAVAHLTLPYPLRGAAHVSKEAPKKERRAGEGRRGAAAPG